MKIIRNIFIGIIAAVVVALSTAGYLAYQAGYAVVDGISSLAGHELKDNRDGITIEFPEDDITNQIDDNTDWLNQNTEEIEKVNKNAKRIEDLINDSNATLDKKISELTKSIGAYSEASEQERAIISESINLLQISIEKSLDGLESDIHTSEKNNAIALEALMEDYTSKIAKAKKDAKDKADQDKLDKQARLRIVNKKEIEKYERKLKRTNNIHKIAEYNRILKALKGE